MDWWWSGGRRDAERYELRPADGPLLYVSSDFWRVIYILCTFPSKGDGKYQKSANLPDPLRLGASQDATRPLARRPGRPAQVRRATRPPP